MKRKKSRNKGLRSRLGIDRTEGRTLTDRVNPCSFKDQKGLNVSGTISKLSLSSIYSAIEKRNRRVSSTMKGAGNKEEEKEIRENLSSHKWRNLGDLYMLKRGKIKSYTPPPHFP